MVTYTQICSDDAEGSFKATKIIFDNDISIIADPGWNGTNLNSIASMEKHLSDVSMILLSHSTPEYIGGYMILCTKLPFLMSSIPVYATVAVTQLGRVSTVEFYRSRGILGPLDTALMEVSDVDECFDKMTLVKFMQNMNLLDNRLVLTAYNSGHSLGGAFWLISRKTEKVVYAPGWNHSKDSFLNSASFLLTNGVPIPSLLRPSTLITSTNVGSSMAYKKRTEKFIQLVDATLANGGAVFMPVSISGRFLELLHIIDEHLADLQGAAIPVYFLAYSGTKVLSYASNLLDWMSSQLIKEYEGIAAEDRSYSRLPFEPSKVDLLLNPHELVQYPGPKIVFSSGLDFKDGDLSTQVLQQICQDEKTTIILTEKSPFSSANSIMSDLFEHWHDLAKKKNNGVAEDGVPVPLEKTYLMSSWSVEETLERSELNSYKERIAQLRRLKLIEKVRDKKNKNILNAEADESSSSSEEEDPSENESEPQKDNSTDTSQAVGTVLSHAPVIESHEVFIADYILENLDASKPVDIKVTPKLRPKQAMFPSFNQSKKKKVDDYGEVIDPLQFRISDDNKENSKLISESKRKFELNDKGKWGDENGENRGGKRKRDEPKGAPKLTPQQVLNNQLLQRNLDTLFRPVKRVPLSSVGSLRSAANLKVRCGLSFVDLAGLVDLRSLSMIVSVLRPHNLVLLPDSTYKVSFGTELDGRSMIRNALMKQRQDLSSRLAEGNSIINRGNNLLARSHDRSKRMTNNDMTIFDIEPNEVYKIGNESLGSATEFEIKFDPSLSAAISWKQVSRDHRVAQVHGELAMLEEHLVTPYEKSTVTPTLLLRPVTNTRLTDPRTQKADDGQNDSDVNKFGPILGIGNLRLTELKKRLISRNMNAEFKGEGVLVVNNQIAISKIAFGSFQDDDSGDVIIDGQVGPLFYEVKKCVTELLAFV